MAGKIYPCAAWQLHLHRIAGATRGLLLLLFALFAAKTAKKGLPALHDGWLTIFAKQTDSVII